MVRILIVNCTAERSRYAHFTKGGEAALFGTIYALRRCFPQASFVTLMQCPESWSRELNLMVVRRGSLHSLRPYSILDILQSSLDLLRAAFWSMLQKLFHLDWRLLVSTGKLHYYREADFIVHLGGDLYSEDFGLMTIIQHSKEILLGAMLEKPVVIYAESLGPFRSTLSSWLANLTLNRVSLITVREDISKENLLKVNVTKPPIYVTADPAFLLGSESPEKVRVILRELGCDGCRPLIGLTLSEDTWIYGSAGRSTFKKLVKMLYRMVYYILPERVLLFALNSRLGRNIRRKAIDAIAKPAVSCVDYLTEQFNATVLLIPHATHPVLDVDEINQRVFQLAKNKSQVRLIKFATYSSREIKGLIGRCDLFIGTKMHACIAAWSQAIPVISIAHSHKYYGVARSLGQEQYVCENIATPDAIDKICEAYARRQEIKEELRFQVSIVRELAELNAELVRKVMYPS